MALYCCRGPMATLCLAGLRTVRGPAPRRNSKQKRARARDCPLNPSSVILLQVAFENCPTWGSEPGPRPEPRARPIFRIAAARGWEACESQQRLDSGALRSTAPHRTAPHHAAQPIRRAPRRESDASLPTCQVGRRLGTRTSEAAPEDIITIATTSIIHWHVVPVARVPPMQPHGA